MKLESKWIEDITSKLNKLGYINTQRGLITYGGKDNGTVDLLATNNNDTKSIVVELKQHYPHLLDLSQFVRLKNNISKDEKLKKQEVLYYLIVCNGEVGNKLKELGREKGIIIEKFEDFIRIDAL